MGLYAVCTISLFTLASIYIPTVTVFLARQAVIEFRATKTKDYEHLLKYLGQEDAAKAACG